MPIYAYICQECNQDFEAFDGHSESNYQPSCPACGSEETARQIAFLVPVRNNNNFRAPTSSCASKGQYT
jgi:putative FmdB family regulatory protein